MNEEELRAKVLLPWLNRLGLQAKEVAVEHGFVVRLGRVRHTVRGALARGRADLLIRDAGGANLFIVELKAPGLPLTDEDRDQGISYARLVHPIAPFVLVTNGEESRLFDSVSQEELTSDTFPTGSSFYTGGRMLATTEDLRIRWEALQNFLGYSVANVKEFSERHLARQMEPLLGGATGPGKFLPDVYVHRAGIEGAVSERLSAGCNVIAILGESGVGKTSVACTVATALAKNHVTLFFPVLSLPTGPFDALLEEFNWDFSTQVSPPDLFQRLAKVAREVGRPVVVFLDGLDEAVSDAFPHLLDQFVRRIREQDGLIRAVVTAKTSYWERFTHTRGVPTQLSLALASPTGPSESGEECAQPLVLRDFSEAELAAAEVRYQKKFQLGSRPTGRLREHCRNPFFLRVISEAYQGLGRELPDDLATNEVAQRWLTGKLSQTATPEQCLWDLRAVAGGIWTRAQQSRKGRQTFRDRETVSELDLEAPTSPELVAQGLLVRTEDGIGRGRLRFYHARIRDYLISRYVLRLDELTADDFTELLPDLLANHIGESTLAWHLQDAPLEHRSRLGRFVRGRAALFLEAYSRLIALVVPGDRNAVEPYTAGEIGVAYEVDDHGLRAYGVFPLGDASEMRVRELKPEYDGRSWPFARELEQLGGLARGGGTNFSNTPPEVAAVKFFREGLLKTLENGGLNEGCSRYLALESLLAICSSYRDRLGFPPGPWRLRTSSLLPIDLDDLGKRIQSYYGAEFYKQRWIDQQLAADSPSVTRLDGNAVRIRYDPAAIAEAARRGRLEAQTGAKFPTARIYGEGDFRHLPDLIAVLQDLGIEEVRAPLLPEPDLEPPPGTYALHHAYSTEKLRQLLQTFFTAVLESYKALVGHSLAGLKPHLALYGQLPCSVAVAYHSPQEWNREHSWGLIDWAFCPIDSSDPSPTVYIDPPARIFRRNGERTGAPFTTPDGRPLPLGFGGSDMHSLLSPYNAPGFGPRARGVSSAREAPVRAFVYDLLRREVGEIPEEVLLEALANG